MGEPLPRVHLPAMSFLGTGAVYAGTMAMQRAITFLLLPIFTRVLSPEEYGELSIALSANAVAVVVFSFGLEPAIFRGIAHRADDFDERNRFIGSIWTFLLVASPLAAVVATAVMAPVLWTSPIVSVDEFGLSMLAASIYVAATMLPLTLLRMDRRVRDFVIVNGVATVTTVVPMLLFVAVFHMGVMGWLVALSVGASATLLATAVVVPYRRPRPVDRTVIQDALRRGLPVMPHFAAMWSLQLADRVLLAMLVTTAAVGIYSLASNLALPLLLLTMGVNQAFMPAYAHAGKSNSIAGLRPLIELQVAVVAVLSLACALLAPPAINMFLDAQFQPAANLTPWFVLGYGFLGLYAIPMNGVTLTYGRSRRIWVISITAALVNLGLIYALAPRSGLVAAAIASAAGYGVLLLGMLLYSSQTNSTLPYPWRPISVLLGIGGIVYAGAVLTVGSSHPTDIVLRLAWILAALVMMTMIVGRHRTVELLRIIRLRRLQHETTDGP